jgi:hypothetical protein
MPPIALMFMTAAACMVAGTTMGITHDFALAPGHAHLNLLGWASLALTQLAPSALLLPAARPAAASGAEFHPHRHVVRALLPVARVLQYGVRLH